jgi:hypothetical protein
LCVNGSDTYSVTNVSGLNYVWTLPSGWNGSSNTNQIIATAGGTSGNIAVTAGNSCGASNPSNLSVTVNVPPSVALTAFNDVCSSSAPFALSGGTPTGGIYTVNGTTASTYTPSGVARTDTVTYVYTDGNTCSASATQLLKVKNCTGIEEVEMNAIRLYPNPVTNELKVQIGKGAYDVFVSDALGQVVDHFSWTILSGEAKTVNTSSYSSGIYFIQVNELGKRSKVLRVVKEE